jgi:serine/threonine-protein kinase ULK/ATG1
MIKRKRFKEDEAFDVIRQIICGFAQLVHERIVHRDLKPANILIHDGVFKIADFGFAKYVDNFGSQMLKSCVGSPIYMAPQLLERTPYTTKCDIWSIGIIFYEMLFGSPPWKARDEN